MMKKIFEAYDLTNVEVAKKVIKFIREDLLIGSVLAMSITIMSFWLKDRNKELFNMLLIFLAVLFLMAFVRTWGEFYRDRETYKKLVLQAQMEDNFIKSHFQMSLISKFATSGFHLHAVLTNTLLSHLMNNREESISQAELTRSMQLFTSASDNIASIIDSCYNDMSLPYDEFVASFFKETSEESIGEVPITQLDVEVKLNDIDANDLEEKASELTFNKDVTKKVKPPKPEGKLDVDRV